jgi:uncharacterized membrane protein
MDSGSLGRLIIALGIIAVAVGALIAVGALSWFGRLPGDIRIKGENTRVFIPITSMILLSVVASVLLSLLRRWL